MVRILIITIVIGAGLFILPESTNASCWLDPNSSGCPTSYQPMVQWPGVTQQGQAGTFASYAVAIYSVAIVVAALLAVVRLVIAGVKYMTTDIVSSKGEARNDIIGSLLGLLIIISAVIILNTINPNLTTITIANPVPNPQGIGGVSNQQLITWSQTAQSLACNAPGMQCVTADCPFWRLPGTSCSDWCNSLGGTQTGSLLGNAVGSLTGGAGGLLNTGAITCTYAVDSTNPNDTAQAQLIGDTVAVINDPSTVFSPAVTIDPATDRLLYCGTGHDNTSSCQSVSSQCTSGQILPGGAAGTVTTVNVTRTISRWVGVDTQVLQTMIVCGP